MASATLAATMALGAFAAKACGQAIIGDGNVILGVGDAGFLNVPYKQVGSLGLPSADPASVDYVGLRNPAGDITAVEQGCQCEGWGAGIRDGPPGTPFLDECGAESFSLTNAVVDDFRGSDGDDNAQSTVLCGQQQLLYVRHQFRSAKRRRGCDGAYEIKVTIENRGCKEVGDVIYRRVLDWDIDPTPFSELVTIQGTDAAIFEDAANNGFCSMAPSEPCEPLSDYDGVTTEVPYKDLGPFDHGAYFQVNLGKLAKGQRVLFRMYYGYFDREKDAKACIDGAKIDLYSLGQDENERNTFLFGFRRSISKIDGSGKDCVPVSRTATKATPSAAAFAADAAKDSSATDTAATTSSSGAPMTQADKMAMNQASTK